MNAGLFSIGNVLAFRAAFEPFKGYLQNEKKIFSSSCFFDGIFCFFSGFDF